VEGLPIPFNPALRARNPTERPEFEVTRTLHDILLTADRRPQVVDDCQHLIDEEVAAKNGASGLLVKSSYKIVKAVRPSMIRDASDSLLGDFVPRLEPFYAQYCADPAGSSLPEYFAERAEQVADAMLAVTDERAANYDNATLRKTYEKLRPQAKKHVEEAVPALSRLIEKYAKM
jgi:hypothetical protein